MANPLVSIVVPSYNHGRFIGKMIDSVISQTYTNWELIIVDNHSTDHTDLIVSKYLSDKRIRLLKINNEGIVAISRNKGIQESTGSWIAFLDSDDGWHPYKLEKCMPYAEDADLIYHNMQLHNADRGITIRKVLKSRKLIKPVFKDLLICGNTLVNSSVVVRKSLIERVNGLSEDRAMIAAEDYHLWLKIAQRTNRFVHVPEQLGFYTIHGQGLSQRDTSSQQRKVVSEFFSELTQRERGYAESLIRYSRIRTIFHTGKGTDYLNDFFYCLRYGAFRIKLKFFLTILQLLLVSLKNTVKV